MEELLHQPKDEIDSSLELANDRKTLFQLLSFLDERLPECCATHTIVNAALVTRDPFYRIYFRRKHSSLDANYSVIVGVRLVPLIDSENQGLQKKYWIISSWTLDEAILPVTYYSIDEIDWKKDNFFLNFYNYKPHPAIENFMKERNASSHMYLPMDRLVLLAETDLNLKCPENVYVKSLECCDAQLVYDSWPYNQFSTVENVARGIRQLPSAGVYLKENDQLVSWMMCNPPGGMGRLHTLEKHRRKGYAKIVIQYLSKRMLQSGFIPNMTANLKIDSLSKLYENMGFRAVVCCNLNILS